MPVPEDEIFGAESFLPKLGFLNFIFLNFSRMFEAGFVSGASSFYSIGVKADCVVESSGFFSTAVNKGNSVMRTIHYPPVQNNEIGERAGAHEDINLITLLIGGHKSGLEILSKEGEWQDATVEEDVIICNIGDMLQRLTNNYLRSTTHRVSASSLQSESSRYSIPFFVHPNPDWLITTLPSCFDEDRPNLYTESILAEDYLQERLKEIKLI